MGLHQAGLGSSVEPGQPLVIVHLHVCIMNTSVSLLLYHLHVGVIKLAVPITRIYFKRLVM